MAPDGTTSYEAVLSGNGFAFRPQPAFHDTTITPDQLGYADPTVTATGRLTTYDPNQGDLGTPWAGPVTVELDSGQYSVTSHTLSGDGGFTLSFQPSPQAGTDQPTHVEAIYALGPLGLPDEQVLGATKDIALPATLPTRLQLDQASSGTLTAGAIATITGTLQYQDTTGAWHPVPHAKIELGQSAFASDTAPTDTNGRFTLTATVPQHPTAWELFTSTDGSTSRYLAPSQAAYTITAVDQAVSLQLSGASVDAHSNLTFRQGIADANGHAVGGEVMLQQSANGSSGWSTIATLPATDATHTLHVTNPHGYWRLYHPTSTGYAAATSNTIHTFRYQTRLTGGPSTTVARSGQVMTFSGHLQEQGYGPWINCTGATVQIVFRPNGSNRSYTMATAHTDGQGYFASSVKITGSGTWYVVYQTTSLWSTDASTPGSYIRVR